jgi:thioredoxin-like negative regulator of GroEL
MKVFMSLLLLLQASQGSAKVLELNEGNMEKTEGKAVFIKFFEPGCAPCHEMEEAWEKLDADWKGHAIGLIAEVNCLDHADLCDEFDIDEVPSLLYGHPSSLDKYDGERDYESLSAFAKKTIGTKPAEPKEGEL